MPLLKINGKNYEVNDEGYLLDWKLWSEDLAKFLAEADGKKLEDIDWEIIYLAIEYFKEEKCPPILSKFISFLKTKNWGKEEDNHKLLYELYPEGPMSQVCKYAGLPWDKII